MDLKGTLAERPQDGSGADTSWFELLHTALEGVALPDPGLEQVIDRLERGPQ